jgi:hypothetical protein
MKTKFTLGQQVWYNKVLGLVVEPTMDTISAINAQIPDAPYYGLADVISSLMGDTESMESMTCIAWPVYRDADLFASKREAIEAAIELSKNLFNDRLTALANMLIVPAPKPVDERSKRLFDFEALRSQVNKGDTIKTHPVYACRTTKNMYAYFGKDLKSALAFFQKDDVEEVIFRKSAVENPLDQWFSHTIKNAVDLADNKE